MKCSSCEFREWSEGDIEYSPPGYGVYFCKLLDKNLDKNTAFYSVHDECPLNKQLEFIF
jgi:hypothetical protein